MLIVRKFDMWKPFIFVMFGVVSFQGHSAVSNMSTAIVESLVTSEGVFGACMVRLKDDITDATGLNCNDRWVSLSCSGDFNSVADASRLLNIAQMAQALTKRVIVRVDDSKKHNGYCVATRITVN